MSYAILPEPGGEYLCSDSCQHADCASIRLKLDQACRYCGEAMQPNDRYVTDDRNTDRIIHWACAIAEIDARQAAVRKAQEEPA